jgi:hypothetical protein
VRGFALVDVAGIIVQKRRMGDILEGLRGMAGIICLGSCQADERRSRLI